MTRTPLELLVEGWETRARMLDENAKAEPVEQTARYYAARATELWQCAVQLREVLNAQAEAEAVWKARMNHACVRLDMRSQELTERSKKAVGADKARDYWMGFGYASAAEVVSQEYRAALAQAEPLGNDGAGEGA